MWPSRLAPAQPADLPNPAGTMRAPGLAAWGSRLALGLLAALPLAVPAVAAPPAFDLPPITDPQGSATEHHAGKPVWAELVTPDLAVAKTFYAGLFGWTFRDFRAPEVDYAVAYHDGRPVGGMLQHRAGARGGRQASWLTFLAVADLDASLRIALEHGGRQIYAARTFPNRGRQAVIADPEGAVVALLASSSGDPPDFLPDVGEWVWSTLLATDPDADAAFYQTVFGYEVYTLPGEDGLEHLLLASDDSARASVNTLPTHFTNRHPHWLNFIRVADAGAATVEAVRLGGRILVEVHADRHGGMVAVIADPSGAAVGLMEWKGTEEIK